MHNDKVEDLTRDTIRIARLDEIVKNFAKTMEGIAGSVESIDKRLANGESRFIRIELENKDQGKRIVNIEKYIEQNEDNKKLESKDTRKQIWDIVKLIFGIILGAGVGYLCKLPK